MKASEVRNLTDQELALKERNLREEMHRVRFQKYTGELADTDKLRRLKRDLARVLTELGSRAQAAKAENGS